jgi:hypothetical protein
MHRRDPTKKIIYMLKNYEYEISFIFQNYKKIKNIRKKLCIMNNTSSMILNTKVRENLAKWEELAPLKDTQSKSVQILNQLNQFDNDSIEFDSNFDLEASKTDKKNEEPKASSVQNVFSFKF